MVQEEEQNLSLLNTQYHKNSPDTLLQNKNQIFVHFSSLSIGRPLSSHSFIFLHEHNHMVSLAGYSTTTTPPQTNYEHFLCGNEEEKHVIHAKNHGKSTILLHLWSL